MKDKTFLMIQGAMGGRGVVVPRERIDWFVLVFIMLFSLINALVIIKH